MSILCVVKKIIYTLRWGDTSPDDTATSVQLNVWRTAFGRFQKIKNFILLITRAFNILTGKRNIAKMKVSRALVWNIVILIINIGKSY